MNGDVDFRVVFNDGAFMCGHRMAALSNNFMADFNHSCVSGIINFCAIEASTEAPLMQFRSVSRLDRQLFN